MMMMMMMKYVCMYVCMYIRILLWFHSFFSNRLGHFQIFWESTTIYVHILRVTRVVEYIRTTGPYVLVLHEDILCTYIHMYGSTTVVASYMQTEMKRLPQKWRAPCNGVWFEYVQLDSKTN